MGGILQAFAGKTVDEYASAAATFLAEAPHPTLGRRLRECAYVPMVELLRYLEAHGFTSFIASGGSRDFMRAITDELYGVPPERVIGSSNGARYIDDEHGGSVAYLAEPDVFDDGPVKPVRIWSRIGRRPILAGGNSNGDIPMLRFAGGKDRPALRLLVLHDDAEREFDYVKGAEQALERAQARAGRSSASRTTGRPSSPIGLRATDRLHQMQLLVASDACHARRSISTPLSCASSSDVSAVRQAARTHRLGAARGRASP